MLRQSESQHLFTQRNLFNSELYEAMTVTVSTFAFYFALGNTRSVYATHDYINTFLITKFGLVFNELKQANNNFVLNCTYITSRKT